MVHIQSDASARHPAVSYNETISGVPDITEEARNIC